MQQRHTDRKRYFNELANTSENFYVDYLRKFTEINKNTTVLEIGCGEGGNLLPFSKLGCKVTGIDAAESRIEQAKTFFFEAGCAGRFVHVNFFDAPQPNEKYDIILIHDVFEHISRKNQFIKKLNGFLKKDSIVFWGFPAWHMPFGGHQQICKSKIMSSLPFIHLLPERMYVYSLKLFGENESTINELVDIKQCGVTVEAFEKLMKENGHIVIDRQLWFINPHYEQKFGLKPKKLNKRLSKVRYMRNFLSSSCFYITKIFC